MGITRVLLDVITHGTTTTKKTSTPHKNDSAARDHASGLIRYRVPWAKDKRAMGFHETNESCPIGFPRNPMRLVGLWDFVP